MVGALSAPTTSASPVRRSGGASRSKNTCAIWERPALCAQTKGRSASGLLSTLNSYSTPSPNGWWADPGAAPLIAAVAFCEARANACACCY